MENNIIPSIPPEIRPRPTIPEIVIRPSPPELRPYREVIPVIRPVVPQKGK